MLGASKEGPQTKETLNFYIITSISLQEVGVLFCL